MNYFYIMQRCLFYQQKPLHNFRKELHHLHIWQVKVRKNGRIKKCDNLKIRQWKNGRVEDWNFGMMEERKSGKMEELENVTIRQFDNEKIGGWNDGTYAERHTNWQTDPNYGNLTKRENDEIN